MRTTLDNGVVVISERIPGVRSVATGVWIRHGGAHETEEQGGASHLLEHMVFKGTRRRTAGDLALALERLGGSLDAYTTREHTAFQARVLDEHFSEALDVLSDLVLEPRLAAADLEVEREVVLEEIAQVEDTPDDLVFELHAERFWRGHPYGRPILGTTDSVSAMTEAQLLELHGERYTGRNLVLAVAGNVEHDEVLERATELFGDVPEGERAPPVEAPTDPMRGGEVVNRPSAQTHLVFGTDIPGRAHPDRYAHILLSAALGGGMSSRLFQRVRESMGLCYTVFSFQSFLRARGVSGVYVGTRPGTATRAEEAVRQELDLLARDGLSGVELEDIRRQVKGQIMLALESPVARLDRLASLELHDEPFTGLDELLARIDAVTQDDVRRIAREDYGADRHFTLALGPVESGTSEAGR
ncbi:MAG: pitrilysin family protein [Gemmatimonadota bacterium]|nr:pitrilysin family protein [Gemmatimonadota bacterium]